MEKIKSELWELVKMAKDAKDFNSAAGFMGLLLDIQIAEDDEPTDKAEPHEDSDQA